MSMYEIELVFTEGMMEQPLGSQSAVTRLPVQRFIAFLSSYSFVLSSVKTKHVKTGTILRNRAKIKVRLNGVMSIVRRFDS
jgi:hypothetical protein